MPVVIASSSPSTETFARMDGVIQTPTGLAVPGASVAVLTQPANTSMEPGSPLATLYGSGNSNGASITAASWSGGQIVFTFSATPTSDVVAGSYIGVAGASPSGYNTTVSAPWLVSEVDGDYVTVISLSNPGTYVSGGTVTTSALPNPTLTDGNGHWVFYATPGLYTVQEYGPKIAAQGASGVSVALTAPVQYSVTGSPVTSTGTLALAWETQTANYVLAGPASGSAAAPTFRALVAADIPGGSGGGVSSVAATLAVPGILTQSVTGSPVTSTGTIAFTIGLSNESANLVFAGPTSGGAGQPTFRSLVSADLPSGAALRFSNSEVPSGSGTTFTLANTPNGIFVLGFRNVSPMVQGTDFTLSGATITLAATIGPDTLLFWYTY